MRTLTYYYSSQSEPLRFLEDLKDICKEKGLTFIDICIDGDSQLEQRFGKATPAILVGPYRINNPSSITEIEVAINATIERDLKNQYNTENKSRFFFSKSEKFTLWFSKSYVKVITVLILLFVGFSFLPPMLMSAGRQSIANGIYSFYQILCHQLFFRSFFINGEQPFYPRELANIKGYKTFENVTGREARDLVFAREYTGNEVLGYKVALCQRDVAIYFSLALAGIIFQVTNKKMKPLRWYLWFIIALIPIGLDGFSQLPGLAEGWPGWLPIRESTPLLRIMTGTLFGFTTGLYMFPLMEEGMKETRFQLERKKQICIRLEKDNAVKQR